jgi:pimeloyl-ACP methyl ester carboxylesterase
MISGSLIHHAHQRRASNLTTPLFVKTAGEGESQILFIHGLMASHRYWENQISEFSKNHFIVAPDLLGFGNSPWPKSGYTFESHLNSLEHTLKIVGIPEKPFVIVGHSLGAILALRYAATHPDRVSKVLILAIPLFRTKEDAQKSMKKSSTMESMMGLNSVIAPLLCFFHEALGPGAVPLFRPFMKGFPDSVIEDATKHTWASFHETVENVIIGADITGDLKKIGAGKITLVIGDSDHDQPAAELEKIKALGVEIITVRGDHNFPLQSPVQINDLIHKMF